MGFKQSKHTHMTPPFSCKVPRGGRPRTTLERYSIGNFAIVSSHLKLLVWVAKRYSHSDICEISRATQVTKKDGYNQVGGYVSPNINDGHTCHLFTSHDYSSPAVVRSF